MTKLKPTIVIGAGDHAKVVCALLRELRMEATSFVSPSDMLSLSDLDRAGDDLWLASQDPDQFFLANGIGSVGDCSLRDQIYRKFTDLGFQFPALIHPNAAVSDGASVEPGAQIMMGALIQTDAWIKANAVVNTGAIVEHDCVVGESSLIAPGVTLSGRVNIGARCHIGTGASIIQGLSVSSGATVGAGAVVLQNVDENTTVAGVPAKRI